MAITNLIARKLINYQSEKSFAFKLRQRRAEKIKTLIIDCYNQFGKVDIIDIGGTRTYWYIIPYDFLIDYKVHIAIVNLPSNNPLPENDNVFQFYAGDGCNLADFPDNAFHIAHSNSVIEHVGDDYKRRMFAHEIKRVAKMYYLQTPNFWFPIEPHFVTPFFHWLPEKIQIALILNFDLGWFTKVKSYTEAKKAIDSCILFREGELRKLFPEASIHKERIGFLIKSFMLIKN